MNAAEKKANNFVGSNTSDERKKQVEYIKELFSLYPECELEVAKALENEKDYKSIFNNITESLNAIEETGTELDSKVKDIKDTIATFGKNADLKDYFIYKLTISIFSRERDNISEGEKKFSSTKFKNVIEEKYMNLNKKSEYDKTYISTFLNKEQNLMFDYIFDDTEKEEDMDK